MKQSSLTKLFSIVITMAVIGALIFAGPAQAISVGITMEDLGGSKYQYTTVVDIHAPDFVRLDVIMLEFQNQDSGVNVTCAYNLDKTQNMDYTSSWHNASGRSFCDAVNVTSVVNHATATTSFTGGYGFGYGTDGTTMGNDNVSWSPGYGYTFNFGYGYNDFTTEVKSGATTIDGEIIIKFVFDTTVSGIFDTGDRFIVNSGIAGLDSSDEIQYTYKAESVPAAVIAAGFDFAGLFDGIHDDLAALGIDNNIDICGDNPTNCSGLWFAKKVNPECDSDCQYLGNLSFTGSVDLTDEATVTLLQELGDKLNMSEGLISLDASTAETIEDAQATLTMFNLPFASMPNILVFDADGALVTDIDLTGVTYSSGTLTFNTPHFTSFQTQEIINYSASLDIDSAYTRIDVSSASSNTNSEITVTQDATEVTLNLSALLNAGSVLMNGSITASINTTEGILVITIPENTTINGTTSWDGTFILPTLVSNDTITPTEDSGSLASTDLVINVGAALQNLTFDHAIRLLFPGMQGKSIGYQQTGGTFHKITTGCQNDSQAAGDAVANDCIVNVGSTDMAVWTKHFTYFGAYTWTVASDDDDDGGGRRSSGGGSSLSGYVVVSNTTTTIVPNTTVTNINTSKVTTPAVPAKDAAPAVDTAAVDTTSKTDTSTKTTTPIETNKSSRNKSATWVWLAAGVIFAVIVYFVMKKPKQLPKI